MLRNSWILTVTLIVTPSKEKYKNQDTCGPMIFAVHFQHVPYCATEARAGIV